MSFLPEDYSVPKSTGLYAKLEDGDNKFIMLDSVTLGWQYWNTAKKCIRMQEKPKQTPTDLGTGTDGKTNRVMHFWAIPVYNLLTKQVQILEVTQKRLMGALQELSRDSDWSDPIMNYQITIKKSGTGTDTSFQTLPVQFKGDIEEIKKAYEESEIDMDKYFEEQEVVEEKMGNMDEINPEDIPFPSVN